MLLTKKGASLVRDTPCMTELGQERFIDHMVGWGGGGDLVHNRVWTQKKIIYHKDSGGGGGGVQCMTELGPKKVPSVTETWG